MLYQIQCCFTCCYDITVLSLYYDTGYHCLVFLQFADNEDLQSEWRAAKKKNKLKVVSLIKERTGYTVSPDAMFDIQVSSKVSFLTYILMSCSFGCCFSI